MAPRMDDDMNRTRTEASSERLRLQLEEESHTGARIKVIGVGGGGGNAVNRMIDAASTASSSSPPTPTCRRCKYNAAPVKLQIGSKLTKGLGAGADPESDARPRSRTPRSSFRRSTAPTWSS